MAVVMTTHLRSLSLTGSGRSSAPAAAKKRMPVVQARPDSPEAGPALLKLGHALDGYKSRAVNPILGSIFDESLQLKDVLAWPQDKRDELLRDLAITSASAMHPTPLIKQSRGAASSRSRVSRRLPTTTSRPSPRPSRLSRALPPRANATSTRSRKRYVGDRWASLTPAGLQRGRLAQEARRDDHQRPGQPRRARLGSRRHALAVRQRRMAHVRRAHSRHSLTPCSDISFEPVPASVTLLRMNVVPECGGDTMFASVRRPCLLDRLTRTVLRGLRPPVAVDEDVPRGSDRHARRQGLPRAGRALRLRSLHRRARPPCQRRRQPRRGPPGRAHGSCVDTSRKQC